MLRFASWKVAVILGICALGFLLTLPNLFTRDQLDRLPEWLPHNQIALGLDLQGGSHLLLEIDLKAILDERLNSLLDEVRGMLRPARIGYRGLAVRGQGVTMVLTDPAQTEQAVGLLKGLNPNPLSREVEVVPGDGGRIDVRLTDSTVRNLQDSAIRQSLEIVRRRIDEVGTREPTIQRQGEDRILVQVPGEKNPESIKHLLGQTAKLTFHLVDMDTPLQQALAGNVPPGSEVLPSAERGGGGQMVVRKRVEVSGESLVDAQPTYQQNQPVVSFRFDSAGARKFGAVTREHVGELLAIVLDGKVISAPRIREPILGGSGVISGSFTTQSANELAVLLRAGALPAPLQVVEERSVGPDLGADSIRAGKLAGVVAFLLVAAFMVIYYSTFGVIADIALVVNLFLLFGVLSALQATLTLPGIAGVVLTIGMGVDTNVLIYERIREESRHGKSVISAIETGFREALRTIIDAHVTTLIAAVLLYAFGSGPVRGFAVTLGVGIVANLFTAVTFTRLVVATWLWRTRPAVLPV
jgi:preprotein translocase subunit SecD